MPAALIVLAHHLDFIGAFWNDESAGMEPAHRGRNSAGQEREPRARAQDALPFGARKNGQRSREGIVDSGPPVRQVNGDVVTRGDEDRPKDGMSGLLPWGESPCGAGFRGLANLIGRGGLFLHARLLPSTATSSFHQGPLDGGDIGLRHRSHRYSDPAGDQGQFGAFPHDAPSVGPVQPLPIGTGTATSKTRLRSATGASAPRFANSTADVSHARRSASLTSKYWLPYFKRSDMVASHLPAPQHWVASELKLAPTSAILRRGAGACQGRSQYVPSGDRPRPPSARVRLVPRPANPAGKIGRHGSGARRAEKLGPGRGPWCSGRVACRGRPCVRLALNAEQRAELQRRVRAGTSSQRDGLRARIILGCEDGGSAAAVARRVGVHPRTVERWGDRFRRPGGRGLHDKPRPGAPPKFAPVARLELIALACEPAERHEGKTTRTIAELVDEPLARPLADGIGGSSYQRLLAASDLRPPRIPGRLPS